MGKSLEQGITKEKTQRPNKDMKKYPTSLIFREMQIKTISRYYHIPTRPAKMMKSDRSVKSDRQGYRATEIPYILVGVSIWHQHFEK